MPEVKTEVKITLDLTVKEALWLKIWVQNPIGPENSDANRIRTNFSDALPSIPVLENLLRVK